LILILFLNHLVSHSQTYYELEPFVQQAGQVDWFGRF